MTDQPKPDKKPEQDVNPLIVPDNEKSLDAEKEVPSTKPVDASLKEKFGAGKTAPPAPEEGNPNHPPSDGKPDQSAKPTAASEMKAEGDKPDTPAKPTATSEAKTDNSSGEAKKPEDDKVEPTVKPAATSEKQPVAQESSENKSGELKAKAPTEGQTTRNLNDPDLLKAVMTPATPELKPADGKPSEPKVTQKLPDKDSIGNNNAGTASATQICPTCGHRNRPGIILCENCGTNLMTGQKAALGTRDLKKEQEAKAAGDESLLDTSQTEAMETAGGTVFTEKMILRIEIEGGSTPMLVYPKQEIIMGRRDPNTGGMPDVDLTAYAGYRMGVSRRHAAIRLQEQHLHVSDLGSSNGTFLNGTRLNAHRPYQLRDGDEVRLGQMVLKVFFQSNKDHNRPI